MATAAQIRAAFRQTIPSPYSFVGASVVNATNRYSPSQSWASLCGALAALMQTSVQGCTTCLGFKDQYNQIALAASCREFYPGQGVATDSLTQIDAQGISDGLRIAFGISTAPNPTNPTQPSPATPTPTPPVPPVPPQAGQVPPGTFPPTSPPSSGLPGGIPDPRNIPGLGCSPAPWSIVQPSANAAIAARDSGNSAIDFIARILQPSENHGALWAWRGGTGGDWKVQLDGPLFCPDPDVVGGAAGIDSSSIIDINTIQPGTGTPPATIPGSGGIVPASNFLAPVQPRIIQVRRCPGPTRLAIDGLCYHKNVLPAKLRENRSKKAPVSYSDGQSIRKGFQAAKRIEGYTKRAQKEARQLVPRRRARRITKGGDK